MIADLDGSRASLNYQISRERVSDILCNLCSRSDSNEASSAM